MHVEHHDLAREFPEYKESIHLLKASDAHFVHLFRQYQELDKQICRVEEDIELMSDQELEGLKMKRVHLKDALVKMLDAASAA